jgi:hypothetical protein
MVDYCTARMNAILDLQDNLRPEDTELVAKILDPKYKHFFGG